MDNFARQGKFFFVMGILCLGIAEVRAFTPARPASPDSGISVVETMGMIESADRGATWHFKGHAQFHAPQLNLVDPSVMFDSGRVVLYCLDLHSLARDTAVIYRAEARDSSGLDFTVPEKAFAMYGKCTDPAVVKLPGNTYRMYLAVTGIISATSPDGRTFVQDQGSRTNVGSVPGALVLPDGKVRLFACGQGITSLISEDGLVFVPEQGIRIPVPVGASVVADPHPIRCADGKYRMAYKVRPAGSDAVETDRVYLAESPDGFTWTSDSVLLVTGSVPSLVEMPDGRLRIYYVDFQTTPPAGVLKFVKSVRVTPDSRFLSGSFARVNYVPATDKLVVTFGTKASLVKGTHLGAGYAYKEYTLDMVETGKADTISWDPTAAEANDSGSKMVESNYFLAHVPTEAGLPYCWRLTKYNAATWAKLSRKYVVLNEPAQANTDPSVAWLNGVLDISDQYNPAGIWQLGAQSHHHFFSLDLDSLGTRILADTPHISGASMIPVGGVTYFLSADSYRGDLVVMKYDSTWKYLGAKKLLRQAHWPQGVATDGKRFFVAYVNTSQRGLTTFFPVSTNVHLAAFDLNWHLLEDVALTDFTPTDYMQPGRPWVICHGNRLYVSFDVDQVDPQSLEEMLAWQAVVNIYEIGAGPTAVSQVKEIPGRCRLEQNYPNPFNPTTGIRFQIPGVSEVRLSVYDLLGREVAVLVNGRMGAGAHEVTFDGSALPSGVYFYRLQVRGSDSASPRDSKIGEGRSVETKKLLLVR